MIRKIIRPLLQEIYQDDGWKMLVCCMLVNLTDRRQVDTIREKLGLNTENVVAGVTMAGLSIFTVIYLIGAARRGTMALE